MGNLGINGQMGLAQNSETVFENFIKPGFVKVPSQKLSPPLQAPACKHVKHAFITIKYTDVEGNEFLMVG